MSKDDFRTISKSIRKGECTRAPHEIEPANIEVNTKPKVLTKEDIKKIIPKANDEMVELLVSQLLLSQAQNICRDPKGRRWSKAVTAICLQWYCRSPQSYEAFRESKFLVLPSASTLLLYKTE